jgi:hypothetical protein
VLPPIHLPPPTKTIGYKKNWTSTKKKGCAQKQKPEAVNALHKRDIQITLAVRCVSIVHVKSKEKEKNRGGKGQDIKTLMVKKMRPRDVIYGWWATTVPVVCRRLLDCC